MAASALTQALTQGVAAKAYEAALNDDWEAFKGLYQRNGEEADKPLTVTNDNVLHIAVYSGSKSPVEELLEIVPDGCVGKANDFLNTPLHEAAVIGNVEAAKLLVSKSAAETAARNVRGKTLLSSAEFRETLPELPYSAAGLDARNVLGETPLFRSAAFGVTKMVQHLASELGPTGVPFDVIQSTRHDKTSILHIAVIGQHFETALWLLENDETLGGLKDQSGRTCLHLLASMPGAFKSGYPMGKLMDLIYFYLPSKNEDEDKAQEPNSPNNDTDLEGSSKPGAGNDHRQYHCHSYFRRALSWIYLKFWRCLAKGWPPVDRIWKEKRKHELALKLLKMLIPTDASWVETHTKPDSGMVVLRSKPEAKIAGAREPENYYSIRIKENEAGKVSPSDVTIVSTPTPLLLATSTGIIEIVEEILKKYPQAIEHVAENGQNIMHVAIRHRRKEIISLVKKMRIPMARLVHKIDEDGNTLLHHVADMSEYGGGTQSNPVLQLQEELKWFEDVEVLIPTHYDLHHNANDKSAQESFERSHEQLLYKAQNWLKRTAESCSVIAVLIATAAFTAAYTVPGGSNDKTGLPLLLHSPFFLLFTVTDVLSLISSLTSVVLFISILTSPFRLKDFRYSLPRKLTFAFTFLFLSVALMMLAFSATVVLLAHMKKRWSMLVVYAVGFVPVTVFALLQFPVYVSFLGTLRESLNMKRMVLPRQFKNVHGLSNSRTE
ncbi:hypothetical protein UlMin_011183 [Ulmus minor]